MQYGVFKNCTKTVIGTTTNTKNNGALDKDCGGNVAEIKCSTTVSFTLDAVKNSIGKCPYNTENCKFFVVTKGRIFSVKIT